MAMEPAPRTLPDAMAGLASDNTRKPEDQDIVTTLESYRREADEVRRGGLNSRDGKWEENLNLYWGRYDFSKKANWQAREVLPEVPAFVDRFAAALKEALVSSPDGFFTVSDTADEEKDLAAAVKRMMNVWLETCGTNQTGTPLAFPSVFEEQMKLGALMACSSVVLWKDDMPSGRVAIETVDPRFVWLDHTYRNLYRIRRIEMDRHELFALAVAKDGKGKSIFNLDAVSQLVADVQLTDTAAREQLTGGGTQVTSPRVPVVLDEYLATVLNADGSVLYDKALCVVANGRFLIRGPELNPFWHEQDWLVFTPLVTTPLSVYGRSYMEDFGSVAQTFNELTNMILDAVFTSSMKAFAMVPGILTNPGQVAEGIWPNKIFTLEDGYKPEDFAKALDLGTLPAEAVTVWQTIKAELREAANINEIGMGQFAPKGRTSATEVNNTQESSSAMIRSVAQTVETRWLNPSLNLSWKTGLQHCKRDDKRLAAAAGPELYTQLWQRRRELITRPITFKAEGISKLIQKSKTLRSLMQALQILASNPLLLQEFLKVADMKRLVEMIFELSDIDLTKLQTSQRDMLMRQVVQSFEQAAGGGGPQGQGAPQAPGGGNGAAEAASLAQAMGVANGA